MNKDDAIKYLKQLYPNGGHCWLDEQRIEAIGMAIKALQEDPKECMYSKDNYTDEDRKVLCEGCEEKCKFNKKEEPVSEDLEEAVDEYAPDFSNSIASKAAVDAIRDAFIEKAAQFLYDYNQKQVLKHGARATLGCGEYTINVYEFRKYMGGE